MDDLPVRRLAVTILAIIVVVCFLSLIVAPLLPIITGASQGPEIAELLGYQTAVGMQTIGAIMMVLCPAIVMILINTNQIALKQRILITRIISFACSLTVFFTIFIVNLLLFGYAILQGFMGGTIINMGLMLVFSLIGFIAHFAIFLLLTLGIKLDEG